MAAIRKMLDLSTFHLPEEVFKNLSGYSGVVCYPITYGLLVWVPDDPIESFEVMPDEEIPPEVFHVMVYARSLGCDYVLFDRDAPIEAGLAIWSW